MLYTLWRVFESHTRNTHIFQPEGAEDLAIFDDSNLIEIVQVKAYGHHLRLSDLDPDQRDSFLYRAAKRLKGHASLKVKLVSFSPLGSELRQALGNSDGKQRRVAEKIAANGILTSKEACELLRKIDAVEIDEDSVQSQVYERLRSGATGGDPKFSLDVLMCWMYQCAEKKTKVSRSEFIDKINAIGRCVAGRAAHHEEFGTSIVPIESFEIPPSMKRSLAEEFYRGVPTRYEHILADV
jgi:hypothetical protein